MVIAVIAAAFGPYTIGSIRTEHVVVYGLGAVFLALRSISIRTSKHAMLLAGTWSLYLFIGLIGLFFPAASSTLFGPGSAAAGVDNLLLPIATMLLIWTSATPATAPRLFELTCRLVAWGMAANGVLAIVMTRLDLTPWLRRFWAAPGEADTVSERAATIGRFSGVFNQPAEVGFAYGIAGLAACYVWRDRPARLYVILVPIVLGGLLSVSKVFILGGLPLILWQAWRARRGGGKVAATFVATATFFGIAQSGYAKQWIGVQGLTQLIRPGEQNLVAMYTAGRLGAESSHSVIIAEIMRIDPWFGVGARGLQTSYDNGWVEAFLIAGVIGVACYTVALIGILSLARNERDPDRRRLLSSIAVVSIGASLGISALTANRASTFLWVLVALAVLVVAAREAPPAVVSAPARRSLVPR